MLLEKTILNNHLRGDAWNGITIDSVLVDGVQPTVPAASCRMQFRDSDDNLGYEFTSEIIEGNGIITIDNAETWEFTIDKQLIGLDVGKWNWDFEVIDSDGMPLTVAKGVLSIYGDISHD